MNQLVTEGIILSRTDYGEADRILTVLTPDYGKLRLMAKGVRRVKSKLAGGIELFSVSSITFVRSRSGGIGTLISTRLQRHYGNIVTDLDRTMLGYELIKQLNKITEDEAEADYFEIMHQAFEALDDHSIALPLVHLWFNAQLLQLGGHTPNLQTDTAGNKLDAKKLYSFDLDAMTLVLQVDQGQLGVDHIKFIRLAFDGRHTPKALAMVRGSAALAATWLPLVQAMTREHLT
ncbi:MAG TPA: DNA repair protein RecO [Candidatus Saccharimonadales bacterium]|nr:DNA repair protein RecO [Candidatus Saccharimonadales bacterium]